MMSKPLIKAKERAFTLTVSLCFRFHTSARLCTRDFHGDGDDVRWAARAAGREPPAMAKASRSCVWTSCLAHCRLRPGVGRNGRPSAIL